MVVGEQSDKTDVHFLMDYMSIFSCLIFIFVISLGYFYENTKNQGYKEVLW